ncbi:hypothetical protein COLO4_16336 [Corchorus olitorius]|uniref:Uncharacterized protein n=1 Tax=Corchorus olitorius TaxID=93759 RepID=A0A1R3JHV9_9ROSI|nr:hypothetical protein COLO4_36334 [Corchorus olitorius]OMO94439.1 hypothetical protein COLO4_16336 [Corchorus olitorius]
MGSGYWHDDLLKQILVRLPVKSMFRFKCVAKSWPSLLQNPRFVSQHLIISKAKKNKQLFVYCDNHDDGSEDRVLRLFFEPTHVSSQDLLPQKPQHLRIYRSRFTVSDGLVCVYDLFTTRMTLWNPATREFRILPGYISRNIRRTEIVRNGILPVLGSGWDSSSNDYKVICMWVDLPSGNQYATYRVSCNSWKALKEEDVECLKDLFIYRHGTCVKSVYYWEAIDQNTSAESLLAFHFGDEVFQFIDLPEDQSSSRKVFSLPHECRVSLWTYHYDDDSSILTDNVVWVLNNDGRSWSKLLKIETLSEVGLHGISRVGLYGFWNGLNKLDVELTVEESNLASMGYKKCDWRQEGRRGGYCLQLNRRRPRILNKKDVTRLKEYRHRVEDELAIISFLSSMNIIVIWLTEFKAADDRKEAADESLKAYEAANSPY